MTRQIQAVPELYTDQLLDLGAGAFEVYFHMRVIFVGGDPAGEWHYYGTTPAPEHPDATGHAATRFPFALTQTDQGQNLLYDIAVDAERASLEA